MDCVLEWILKTPVDAAYILERHKIVSSVYKEFMFKVKEIDFVDLTQNRKQNNPTVSDLSPVHGMVFKLPENRLHLI